MSSIKAISRVRRLLTIAFALLFALIGCRFEWLETAPTSEPEQVVEPTVSVTPAEPLLLRDLGFAQEDEKIAFGFIVENPNEDLALEGSGYELMALTEDDTELSRDSGIIPWVPAGGDWGIGGRMTLDAEESADVARISVDLRSGDAVAPYPQPTFDVRRVRVFSDTTGSRVTALVRNPYRLPLTYVRVSAVAFDEQDAVVGGGFTFVRVLPGEGAGGVEVLLGPVPMPSSVELYLQRSSLSDFPDPADRPEGVDLPILVAEGFAQDQRELVWTAKVENPNDGWGHVGLRYHLTVFDKEGGVLTARDGDVRVIFPGQALGLVEEMWLAPGAVAGRVEAAIVPGVYVEASEIAALPQLPVTEGRYETGEYLNEAVGRVENPTSVTIKNLLVTALLYDADDHLVGGGSSWVEVVPAGETVPIRMTVTGPSSATSAAQTGIVARVEIHTQIGSTTEYE